MVILLHKTLISLFYIFMVQANHVYCREFRKYIKGNKLKEPVIISMEPFTFIAYFSNLFLQIMGRYVSILMHICGIQKNGIDELICRAGIEMPSVGNWRRKWQPTLVFLPGESQGQRSLVGCRLWGRTESDTTEATQRQCTRWTCEGGR